MNMITDQLPGLTRIDIIGDTVHEFWADEWMVALQDDGHTLKLFQIGDGREPRAARDKAIVSQLIADIAERNLTLYENEEI